MQIPVKRRHKEELSYETQDPVLLLLENYKVEDDSHETLDTSLRQQLRPINADPTTYWTKGAFKQVERPIYIPYIDHICLGNVHEGTLCKNFDGGAFFEIKNWLTRNAGVQRKKDKMLKIHEVGVDNFSMGVQTNWSQATQVWEVIDAGFNYMAVEFMVRRYSYMALAMMRCLHDVRYFCGVAPNPKLQRKLIEDFFNECFRVSNGQAFGIKVHQRNCMQWGKSIGQT